MCNDTFLCISMSAVNCSGQTDMTTRAISADSASGWLWLPLARCAWPALRCAWLVLRCGLQWVDFITMECSSWSHSKCLNTPAHSKVKHDRAHLALHSKPTSELRSITCHLGSHTATCHPTQVNTLCRNPTRDASTWFTYPRGWEGWVEVVGWLHREIVYLPADSNLSKQ